MFNQYFVSNPTVLTVEIHPDGVLSININNQIGWMVTDEFRHMLVKECIEVLDYECPEFNYPIIETITTLKSHLSREDYIQLCTEFD